MPQSNPLQIPVEEIRSRLESHGLLGSGGLARNPFWLRLILRSQVFKDNRGQILCTTVNELLVREWAKPDVKRSWNKVEERDDQLRHTTQCLAWLAYEMTCSGVLTIDLDSGRLLVKEAIERRVGIEKLVATDILSLARDALLVQYSPGPLGMKSPDLRFRHRILHHFFTASALLTEPQLLNEDIFKSISNESKWWDAIVMLNDLLEADWFGNSGMHASLVSSVLGTGEDGKRIVFASALLWSSDDIMNQELTEKLGAELLNCFKKDPTPNLISGARQLSMVAPELLVRALGSLSEKKEESIQRCLSGILQSVFSAEIESGTAARLVSLLLDSLNLREPARAVLVGIGEKAVLPVVQALNQRPTWGTVETLGELRSADAVEPLLQVLATRKEFLTERAAEALGKIGDKRAVEPLALLARESSEREFVLRSTAIEALGRIGVPAVAAIIKLLDQRDAVLEAIWAEEALKAIGSPAVPSLIEALEHKNPAVRRVAAEALAEIGDPQAANALGQRLKDPDVLARLSVVRALGKMGPSGVEPLLGLLQNVSEDETFFSSSAVSALAEIGAPAVGPLLSATKQEKWNVRRDAAKALGEIGDLNALDRLLELLEHDVERQVRFAAAESLGDLRNPRALPTLRNAARNDVFFVQIGAMIGLAKFGIDPAKDWLLVILEKGVPGNPPEVDFSIRLIVAESLGDLREPRAIVPLEKLALQAESSDRKKIRERAERLREIVKKIKGQPSDASN